MRKIKEKLGRRGIDRLENVIIVVLACLALFLIPRSGLSENVTGQGTGTGTENLLTGVQDTALSRGTPTRLVIQTDQGRFGVQYDQSQTEGLYREGLKQLLLAAVDAMDTVKTITREDWQTALHQTSGWVYYDFLYNVSFTSLNSRGEGAGRLFLLTSRGGRVDTLYYYNDETQDYYQGQLRETLALPGNLDALSPNGAQFAFEVPEVAQLLWPNMVLLSQAALCPVYGVTNPLEGLDESGRQALLETLDFNLRTAAVYEAADGTVIQEGSDTLRLQTNGRLTFHGAESGQARYQALSAREKDLQIKAEEILEDVTQPWRGEAVLRCQSIRTLEDGQVELTFCYLLNGTPVQLWEEGWAARFVFSGSDLMSFTICLRQYTGTDQTTQALPERQAAAAASALGQAGKELQLCYRDTGEGQTVTADWTVREGT